MWQTWLFLFICFTFHFLSIQSSMIYFNDHLFIRRRKKWVVCLKVFFASSSWFHGQYGIAYVSNLDNFLCRIENETLQYHNLKTTCSVKHIFRDFELTPFQWITFDGLIFNSRRLIRCHENYDWMDEEFIVINQLWYKIPIILMVYLSKILDNVG